MEQRGVTFQLRQYTSYGGEIDGNLFGDNIWGQQVWIHSEAGFYNSTIVDFDSLGSYLSFSFVFNNFADSAEHPSEFSFYWMHYPDGVVDHSAMVFGTSDPLGANAIFSVAARNDSTCELTVFSPATFAAPDSIVLGLGAVGIGDQRDGTRLLRILGIWPNPSRDGFSFRFSAPVEQGAVELWIFDVQGRAVFKASTGVNSRDGVIRWPGVNKHGAKVAPGVYFGELKNAQMSVVRRVVVVN